MLRELNLQEIQSQSYEILKKIDEICEEEGLTYFLAYGTLIGAVRHNGFIPWDDDIDIMMPRMDFLALKDYFKNNPEKVKHLHICDRDNCKNYTYGVPRISDDRFIYKNQNGIEKDIDIGTFVDVYILDNYGENYESSQSLSKKINLTNSLYSISINPYNGKKNFLTCFRYLIAFMFKLYKAINRKFSIEKIISSMVERNTNDSDPFIGAVTWDSYGWTAFNKELFEESERHTFEGHEFSIPKHYDEILKQIYGNYMNLPPKEQRIPHHNYKIFEK